MYPPEQAVEEAVVVMMTVMTGVNVLAVLATRTAEDRVEALARRGCRVDERNSRNASDETASRSTNARRGERAGRE